MLTASCRPTSPRRCGAGGTGTTTAPWRGSSTPCQVPQACRRPQGLRSRRRRGGAPRPERAGAGKAFLAVDASLVSDDAVRWPSPPTRPGTAVPALREGPGHREGPRPATAERVTAVAWAADSCDALLRHRRSAHQALRTRSGACPAAAPRSGCCTRRTKLFSLGLGHTRDLRYLVLQASATDAWETRLLRADQPRDLPGGPAAAQGARVRRRSPRRPALHPHQQDAKDFTSWGAAGGG